MDGAYIFACIDAAAALRANVFELGILERQMRVAAKRKLGGVGDAATVFHRAASCPRFAPSLGSHAPTRAVALFCIVAPCLHSETAHSAGPSPGLDQIAES